MAADAVGDVGVDGPGQPAGADLLFAAVLYPKCVNLGLAFALHQFDANFGAERIGEQIVEMGFAADQEDPTIELGQCDVRHASLRDDG